MSNYVSWYTGQTYPAWDIPLTIGMGSTDADAVPEDLTGVDITKFTMIFHNTAVNPAVDTVGTGTFSIKRLYPAELFYKPSPSDVALAFSGTLIVKALFPPSGTTADEMVYDPIPFTIVAIPTTFIPPIPASYVNVMQYGAMGNGTSDDTAAFVAAIAAMPTVTVYADPSNNTGASATYHQGTIWIPPGIYKLGSISDIGNIGPFVSIIGAGHNCTTLAYYGSGDCIRMYNAVNPANQFDTISAWAGKIDGLMIDGTHAGAGATGLHYGDTEGAVLGPDLFIFNFSGAGSKGIWFDNRVSWTENLWVRAVIRNCSTAVLMDYNGASYHSMEYNTMMFKIYCLPNQNAVVIQNGIYYANGSLTVLGNFLLSGTSQSSAALTITGIASGGLDSGSYTQFKDCVLNIQAETDPGAGSFTPQTIKYGDVLNNGIFNCTGVMNFLGSWTPSNWTLSGSFAFGTFIYSGQVSGDVHLSALTPLAGLVVAGAVIYGQSLAFSDGGVCFGQGDMMFVQLTQSITISVAFNSNGPQRKTLWFQQASSGGPYTITWPKPGSPSLAHPAFYWAGGTAPTLSTGAGAVDKYFLETLDGISWFGSAVQNLA